MPPPHPVHLAARRRVAALVLAAPLVPGGCVAPRPAPGEARVAPRAALIVAERSPAGPRLIGVDERGDRLFVAVEPAAGPSRDVNPAVSPDGRWVVFASSRGRPLAETSLWIAPVAAQARARALTTGDARGAGVIDSHPTWTPDGAAIVFASTRAGGDFDLWRLPVVEGAAAGPPRRLTDGAGHEVTPTVAADGAVIYAAVTPTGRGREIASRLEERAPDGAIRALTDGPGDVAPALSPDGRTLAFARPLVTERGASSELWRMPRAGGPAELVVALPLTEESGPVWSRDGRHLFATSILEGEQGVLFSAVVFVDVTARTPGGAPARILQDQAGPIARLTPAVVAPGLDAAHLAAEPEYLPELARFVAAAAAKVEETPPP